MVPPLVSPIPGAVVTGVWQDTRAYRDGVHYGLDFRASRGTPVRAAGSGTVLYTDTTANSIAGKWIAIAHSGGWVSRYLHLDTIYVAKGQRVSQGQVIALSGDTGIKESAAHLHFDLAVTAPSSSPLSSPTPVRATYAGTGTVWHVPAEPFIAGLKFTDAARERLGVRNIPIGAYVAVAAGGLGLLVLVGLGVYFFLRRNR